MKLRTIIIEDEFCSQDLLSNILKVYCPNVELIGIAGSVKEGKAMIEELKPDLTFMDVELGDGNAFDLLQGLTYKKISLVITTAYEEYALKAFKFEAIDYLMKPYNHRDVITAVSRIKTKDLDHDIVEEIHRALKSNSKQEKTLSIATSEGIAIVKQSEIIRLEADGNYTTFILKNKQRYVTSKILKHYEEIIDTAQFYRVHASHIINLNEITYIKKDDGGSVTLSDNSIIPIARSKKQEFLNLISAN